MTCSILIPSPLAFFSPQIQLCKNRDGTCVRDYIHVLDLANGHLLALEALSSGTNIFPEPTETYFKAYNLGRGRGMSVLQIVDAMRKTAGFDFQYEIVRRRYAVSSRVACI